MQEDKAAQRVHQTAALMEQFERSCSQIESRLGALAQGLQSVTQQLPGVVRQMADQSLQSLPGQVMARVKDGLQQPVRDYQQQLDTAGGAIRSGSDALARQLTRMEQLHRMLIWKVVGLTGGCLVLLLAAGVGMSLYYANVIRENQISAALLKAYNAADVVPCGEGLCANVNAQGRRYGSKGEYLPIRAR